MSAHEQHNQSLLPILRLIVEHAPTESDQWVIMESLCCGIGRLNARSARETAAFVEAIAERLCEGARDDVFGKATS